LLSLKYEEDGKEEVMENYTEESITKYPTPDKQYDGC
jgi:hypothetical protein